MASTRRGRSPGYSLMEMVVAMGVATLLLGALGSAVVIAASALPGAGGSATDTMLETSRALDSLAADLEKAVYAPERRVTAASVVLPDHDADGAPELVRYAWSGTEHDPLTLVEDAGDPLAVLDGVSAFALGYDTATRADTYPGAIVTNETQVDSFPAVVTEVGSITLDDGKAFAQHITPSLPEGVASWRPTRFEIYAKKQGVIIIGAGGQLKIQLRSASGGRPTTTVLTEIATNESGLPNSYDWVPLEWATSPTLDAGAEYFLVFGNSSGSGSAGRIQTEWAAGAGLYDGSVDSGTYWSGGDTDPSWSERGGQEILFRLHGEYETQNPDIAVTRRFVTRFTIGATSGVEHPVSLATEARALNAPEVLSMFWDADFASDPTALDLNADSAADWAAADGEFDAAALVGGTWKGLEQLVAAPKTDLTGVTTVDLRWRCVTSGQPGAYFVIAADQGGGEQAVLRLLLRRRDASSQRLTLSYVDPDDGMTTLADVSPTSTAMLDTRLVIDPGSDSVVFVVDGSEVGTFAYQKRAYAAGEHKTAILPLGTGVEVDRARVRMGAP